MSQVIQAMTSKVMASVTTVPLFAISSGMRQFPPRRIVSVSPKRTRGDAVSARRAGPESWAFPANAVRPPQGPARRSRGVSAFISAEHSEDFSRSSRTLVLAFFGFAG